MSCQTSSCVANMWIIAYTSSQPGSTVVDSLLPYTYYDVHVTVTNDVGDIVTSDTSTSQTLPACEWCAIGTVSVWYTHKIYLIHVCL